jgi:peptide/nickel transport system substrate-binding protein
MKRKKWFSMVAAIVLAGVLQFGATSVPAAAPQGVLKQAIHWPISADWLDPSVASYTISAHLPLYLFHDALVKAMPEGLFTPCLAESYTISPDAKVYEFKLRKGVKFHNGDPLTAEDVVFSFYRYKSTQAKVIHGRTEAVEAVNPYLVRFRFKESFPDFLELMVAGATTISWVVPKKYIEKVGDAEFKKHPIGCGPYKFVEFVPGVKLIAEAFEEYWRKVPNIKRLEFQTVRDPATRLTMVRRGEADTATLLQGVFYEDAKKDPKLRLLTPLSTSQRFINLTTQWDPKSPWSDLRVRKAASLAIDRQTLADIHMPGAPPIGSLALKGDPMGVVYPPDPYDPGKAKKLLAEAGHPKGFHGGKFYPYQSGYWPYGEQIVNYWKAVGITVDTILLDRPAWTAQRESKKMKGGLFNDYSVAPTIGGSLSYLLGAGSYGNYPDIQAVWDQYRREVNPKVRKDLITKVQALIHEKMMFIPLTGSNCPTALGPRVKGDPFRIQPLIWYTAPMEDIELTK